jgi:serine/threonine protein kinase
MIEIYISHSIIWRLIYMRWLGIYIYIYIYIYLYINIYICISIYICIYTYIYTYIHIFIRAGILADIHKKYIIWQLLKALKYLHSAGNFIFFMYIYVYMYVYVYTYISWLVFDMRKKNNRNLFGWGNFTS